jgi:5-oxoprolinase (ATP-hydrolysing) subunit C
VLALAGADLDARVDDQPLLPWRSFGLAKGQRLTLNQPKQGVRAYLAAPGGFSGEDVLGSCATVVREELGGIDGRGLALGKEQALMFAGGSPPLREVPAALCPSYATKPVLDLVMGAQIGDFSGTSLFAAFNRDWTLDSRADRMGIRLLGPELVYQGAPMISEGIPLGAVQVPPDGQPIVLLNDRQTIGGYPRLGALTPLALAQLAQCMPGAMVRFRAVVQEEAWREQQAFGRRWL